MASSYLYSSSFSSPLSCFLPNRRRAATPIDARPVPNNRMVIGSGIGSGGGVGVIMGGVGVGVIPGVGVGVMSPGVGVGVGVESHEGTTTVPCRMINPSLRKTAYV